MRTRNHEQLLAPSAHLQPFIRQQYPRGHPLGPPVSEWPVDPEIEAICRGIEKPTQEVLVDEEELFCICLGIDDGTEMVACSSSRCLHQWFHTRCIGMTSLPKEDGKAEDYGDYHVWLIYVYRTMVL